MLWSYCMRVWGCYLKGGESEMQIWQVKLISMVSVFKKKNKKKRKKTKREGKYMKKKEKRKKRSWNQSICDECRLLLHLLGCWDVLKVQMCKNMCNEFLGIFFNTFTPLKSFSFHPFTRAPLQPCKVPLIGAFDL